MLKQLVQEFQNLGLQSKQKRMFDNRSTPLKLHLLYTVRLDGDQLLRAPPFFKHFCSLNSKRPVYSFVWKKNQIGLFRVCKANEL